MPEKALVMCFITIISIITPNKILVCEQVKDTTFQILHDQYDKAVEDGNIDLISNVREQMIWSYHDSSSLDRLIPFVYELFENNPHIQTIDSIYIYNHMVDVYFHHGIANKCLEYMIIRDELLLSSGYKSVEDFFGDKQVIEMSSLQYSTEVLGESNILANDRIERLLETGDTLAIASRYNNRALEWKKQNELDSALTYFNIARDLLLDMENRDPFFFHLIEGNIGEILMLRGELDSAMMLIQKDVEISKKTSHFDNAAFSYISLAWCYLHTGQASRALSCMDSAGKYLVYVPPHVSRTKYYLLRSEILEQLGLHDSALYYANKYIRVTDSVYKVEKETELRRNQIAYATKNMETMISQQREDLQYEKAHAQLQEKIRNISLLVLSFILVLLIVILNNFRKQRRSKLLLEEKNQQITAQSNKLVKANKELEDLDRMKKALVSMIAHDLKTPLNTIISLAHNRGSERLRKIEYAGNNILNLVMNMLDVNKYETGTLPMNIEHLQANTIIKEAINRVILLAENKSIEIKVEIEDQVYIKADRESLIRVFVNLLTNAIKYSPFNSTVAVSAVELDPNWIKFLVRDEGEGIFQEHINKVFEMYYQANAKSSGLTKSTGLGLTYSKMAIEAHGGQIGVNSLPVSGSEFWFTLNRGKNEEEIEIIKPLEIANKKSILEFNTEERKDIQAISALLSDMEFYEVSKIRNILNHNGKDSKNVSLWKKQVICSVSSGNEERYKRLIEN